MKGWMDDFSPPFTVTDCGWKDCSVCETVKAKTGICRNQGGTEAGWIGGSIFQISVGVVSDKNFFALFHK